MLLAPTRPSQPIREANLPEPEYLTIQHLTLKELSRIFSKLSVNKQTGCWEWAGSLNKDGYGKVKLRMKTQFLHRVMYAWAVEPLPRRRKGQRTPNVDHTCRNRRCGNPVHLELVSHETNCRRGVSPSALNTMKTHCKRGHPLPIEPNWFQRKSSGLRPRRVCKLCPKLYRQERRGLVIPSPT